jgi:hypothetical protein
MACGIDVEGVAPLDEGGVTIGEAGMLSGDGAGWVIPDPTDATASSADRAVVDAGHDDAVVDDGLGGPLNPDGASCDAGCADAFAAEGGAADGGTDGGVPEGDTGGAAAEGGTDGGVREGGPDGGTADAGSDAASCSAACNTATGSPTCHGSTCSYVCNQGLADCNAATAPDTDGCESSLSSTASCAACGNACNTSTGTPSCDGTTCSYVCHVGLGDCNANTAPDLDGCETAVTTPNNCGHCGTVCGGACVTHSDGLGANYWSCQPTGTVDETQAMEACTQSNHGACTDVTTSCGDSGYSSAVCACPTDFFGLQYCWVYAGPNEGRAFFGLSVFSCGACPAGGTQAWN